MESRQKMHTLGLPRRTRVGAAGARFELRLRSLLRAIALLVGTVPSGRDSVPAGGAHRTGSISGGYRPPFQAFSNSGSPAPYTARRPWSVWYWEVPGAIRASPTLARRSSGAVFPLALA